MSYIEVFGTPQLLVGCCSLVGGNAEESKEATEAALMSSETQDTKICGGSLWGLQGLSYYTTVIAVQ